MSLALFRVNLSAATSQQRPPLWAHQSGWIEFYLFGTDRNDAVVRAEMIAKALPFVLLEETYVYELDDGPRLTVVADENSVPADLRDLREMRKQMEENARKSGFAFAFFPIGQAQPTVGASKVVRMVLHPTASRN